LLNRYIVLFSFLLIFRVALPAQDISDSGYSSELPFWRQALGGAVTGRPVSQAESVVATTDGGNLKSYSLQGNLLWDYYARGRLLPYVTRSREGTSYICRTNGLFIAVNRAGRELWRINLGTPLVYPALVGWDGRLFIFTAGKITCMTAAGYTLWSKALGNRIAIAPIRDAAGGIVVALEGGEVLRFDPFGSYFSYTSNSPGAAPAAAAALEIEGTGHAILLLYRDRHVELAYPEPGYGESLRGKLDLPAAPLAGAGRKDEAALLLENGQIALLSLSPDKRRILWTAAGHIRAGELPERPGPNDLDIFYDERGIYLLTKTGASAYAADGRRLWYILLRGAAAIPSFGDDGVLYSGGLDWILYAYRLEDRVRVRQRALYGEAPEGSYGAGTPGPSSWAGYPYRFGENELNARLAEIRRAIRDGAVGANEKEYAAWLMETAGSVAANPRMANQPPVHSRYRVEAASLLAYLGSRETIPFLANLFSRDPDAAVKTAAAAAIGRIGVDPEGHALRAFENAVFPPSPPLDEAVLAAVAAAAGALCRFSGPPLSDRGVRILTFLAGAEKPPRARSQARQEIRSL
jgi:outer membrane protein assembly factor BamB